jgi:hypothetical protein
MVPPISQSPTSPHVSYSNGAEEPFEQVRLVSAETHPLVLHAEGIS